MFKKLLSASLITAGFAVLSTSAFATTTYWGAIAYDPSTGNWGDSWNYATKSEASAKALTECGDGGCTVVNAYDSPLCGALAESTNNVWDAPSANGLGEAKYEALETCITNHGMNCRITAAACADQQASPSNSMRIPGGAPYQQ